MEYWKQINNFENYEVSNKGRVRNIKTGKIIKTSVDKKGYEHVQLCNNGNRYSKMVHRLVAEAFRNDYRHEYDVTHVDGNRGKNHVDNLECRHRSAIARNTYRKGRRQLHRMKQIVCVETGIVYDSIIECSRDMSISRESISKCVNNPNLHTADGYHFRLID